jgi:hypothetical protein
VGWVIAGGVVLGFGWLCVREYLAQPAPPASLRCGTCPKLQRQLQGWKLGTGVLAGLLLITFVWAISR